MNESQKTIDKWYKSYVALDKPKLISDDDLLPFLITIPLQKLAYHSALKKGYDIDKPRNLAKSVTVE